VKVRTSTRTVSLRYHFVSSGLTGNQRLPAQSNMYEYIGHSDAVTASWGVWPVWPLRRMRMRFATLFVDVSDRCGESREGELWESMVCHDMGKRARRQSNTTNMTAVAAVSDRKAEK
jgi:hypothetical protein